MLQFHLDLFQLYLIALTKRLCSRYQQQSFVFLAYGQMWIYISTNASRIFECVEDICGCASIRYLITACDHSGFRSRNHRDIHGIFYTRIQLIKSLFRFVHIAFRFGSVISKRTSNRFPVFAKFLLINVPSHPELTSVFNLVKLFGLTNCKIGTVVVNRFSSSIASICGFWRGRSWIDLLTK